MLRPAGSPLGVFGVDIVEACRRGETVAVDDVQTDLDPRQIALVEITAERTWAAAERARTEDAFSLSESRQAFLRRLNDTIRPLADPTRILEATCGLLGKHLHVNLVVYAEIQDEDCVVVHDCVDGVASLVGRLLWRCRFSQVCSPAALRHS